MKHVSEMVALEKQELKELNLQRDLKSSELKDLQKKLFEERNEFEKIVLEVEKKDSEIERLNQVFARHLLICSWLVVFRL